MSKRHRNRSASSAPQASNELDAMLEGIEGTVPEGLLAETGNGELDAENAALTEHDAILESLEAEAASDLDDGNVVREDEDLLALAGNEPVIVVENPELEANGVNKQAIYDAQESTMTPASEEDAAPVEQPKKGRGKKHVSGSASGSTPRKITTSGGSRSETLTAKANVEELVKIGIDKDDIAGIVAKMDTLPKKVSEKAYNLLRYACGREQLSNYTRFTIEVLRDDGPMTVPELVKRMEARGWSTGTARSQSQQMSRMFGIYDMIEKKDGKIGLVAENPFVKNIIDRLAGNTPA